MRDDRIPSWLRDALQQWTAGSPWLVGQRPLRVGDIRLVSASRDVDPRLVMVLSIDWPVGMATVAL